MVLILELTFEGVVRKLAGPIVGAVMFFAKDLTILSIAVLLLTSSLPFEVRWMGRAWRVVCVLCIPPVCITALHDPKLAVFGAKQYLLFAVLGLAIPTVFRFSSRQQVQRFCFWLAVLIVPTTSVAILQSMLPVNHWLNLSVAGESLEAFSAGGRLRVASTFPFGAQYCMFLNAQLVFLAIAFGGKNWWKWLIFAVLSVMLIVSTFVTGSRGAVVVNGMIVVLALTIWMVRRGMRGLFAGALFVGFGVMAFSIVRMRAPEFFEAYEARVEGTTHASHTEEMVERVTGMFSNWGGGDSIVPALFGHGLGVMSNGSDRFSAYAATLRMNDFWTETDLATTYFEGGYYLVLVWMTFRCWIIYQCWRLYRALRNPESVFSGAFCLAYIIVMGVAGTLAIQPPLACWWWISIGMLTALAAAEYRALKASQELMSGCAMVDRVDESVA